MALFWKIVNNTIKKADLLLLVIDSRFPQITMNKEVEKKIKQANKHFIITINKCDLVTEEERQTLKRISNSVLISAKKKLGGTILFKRILQIMKGKPCIVGVLGYPNTGKSSVINLLKGQKSAGVSSRSGYTRGKQVIKAKGKITLIDTPGVLEYSEKDITKGVLIGSVNPEKLKEPDFYALQLVEKYQSLFETYYNKKIETVVYDFLEELSIEKKILVKGGKPDLPRFSRKLLYDWQSGKIHEKILTESMKSRESK